MSTLKDLNFDDTRGGPSGPSDSMSKARESRFRYRRLRRFSILLMSLVALTPLVTMTVLNFHQYQKAIKGDMVYPFSRQTSDTRHALEAFITERRSALNFVIGQYRFEELADHGRMSEVFGNLKSAFGGFIDLGLIDSKGNQVSYIGPYSLEGKNYRDQDWFHEVSLKGVYVSDVFIGYRGFPHFVIAVMRQRGIDDYYILRATIDSDMLYRDILSQNLRPSNDAFLINKNGVLQTPSHLYGKVLDTFPLPVPSPSAGTEISEQKSGASQILMGYAFIEGSPFILIETAQQSLYMQNWLSVRNNLIVFLVLSIIVILAVIIWGAYHMVGQIRRADLTRTKILHEMEYTSKMASIGRVAAGVAHEINNPMAIINENAGMIKDLLSVSDNFPMREKVLKHTNSILGSVDRVSKITHRLLGFAKRMDPQVESIDLRDLVNEVLSFLGKEALHRNIKIDFKFPESLPQITSDKGQLQQVLLNIINNAIEAVKDGGAIVIEVRCRSDEMIDFVITDDGPGMSREDLERIFEPFFTTKKKHGTGLGLSITYGIVQKLGGRIDVKSKPGSGTTFTVTLPIESAKG
jgi:two-component system NtrC family sensor kinase